ncbi:MAG: hybrid sensor histidine kinase/response regulator [Mariprofundaceae bacterium]
MSGFDLSGFLASFFDEAKGRLANINQNLVRFESGELDEEGLIEIRRDAHTIKGSALMLGVKDVGDCAHLFEDAMAWLIEHHDRRSPGFVQFLFDLHDALLARVSDYEGGEAIDVPPLRARFEQLQQGEDMAPAEAPASSPVPETDASGAGQIDLDASAGDMDLALSSLAEAIGGGAIADESDIREHEAAALPAADQVIGAEEADAWKAERARAQSVRSEPSAATEASDTAGGSGAAEAAPLTGEEGHASSADAVDRTEDFGTGVDDHPFRPQVDEADRRSARRAASGRFMRVDADRLERLSNQIIELSTEKGAVDRLEERLSRLYLDLRLLHRNWRNYLQYATTWPENERRRAEASLLDGLDRQMSGMKRLREDVRHGQVRQRMMLDDLRDHVLRLMVLPLDQVFTTFPRAVRDAAIRHGKKVRLVIGGDPVELDQSVGEALAEPLIHLLNNAVAHGIEPPETRRRLGKPEEGRLTIITRQVGGEVHIDVIDDGRGIDVEEVRARAVELGVTTQAEADEMDTAEVLEMIFRPGFSTVKEVSDIAGRGIGMNIVQDAVRKLTGTIRIRTEPGHGTIFSLQLPVSIAVQQALIFRIGDQRFGMLTHMIEQAAPLQRFEIEQGAAGKQFVRYGRHQVPLVDLRLLLGGERVAPDESAYVLISEHIEGFVGIVVDELFEETEIVVRDLDPYLKRYQVQGLMGNTILADGSVLLLFEPYGIKEMGRTAPDIRLVEAQAGRAEGRGRRVLLVEDSIIAREIEKGLMEAAGFEVDTAIDGLDALDRMALKAFDLVVTDLEMPRLDGFGLVRRLRNDPRFEALPVLVISTRESPEDRMRAAEAGADAYLVKQQLTPDNLREHLHRLLDENGTDEASGIDAPGGGQ